MAIANKLENISVGDFGITYTLTLKDSTGTVQDISSYTTRKVHFTSENKIKTFTRTATFTTDGTNGKLDFNFADGNLDQAGVWKGQVELSKSGAKVNSVEFDVVVGSRITP